MEEKERYVIRYDLDYKQCLIDTEENQGVGDYIKIVKLLNQQDKRIKELEKENKKANINNYLADYWLAEKKNQQLKQSQKQLAIEELEKIYNLFEPYENSQKDTILCANNGISFIDYLDNRIKELKGEK